MFQAGSTPEFAAPAQQLDVLKGSGPLLHQAEDRIAEALDAGLNPAHAAFPKSRKLLEPQVRLGLVEELDPRPALKSFGKRVWIYLRSRMLSTQ